MEAWLGVLHLVRQDTETREDFEGIAAVFCADRQGYEDVVKSVVEAQGYQLLWAEEVHPAGQWISRHPKDRSAAGLARAVHPGHRIEVGTLKAVGKEGEEPEEEQPYITIEEIEAVEPLGLQFGVHPRKTVPDSLYEPLFGQPEPTEAELEQYGTVEAVPPMRTYAILDAAKMPYLLTGHLERSELRYQCLFQGETAEELKEHAPYLVELEDGNDFTQRLFTGPEGVNGLWEKELGIYIRSRAEFDEVRKHFRKFTRVQDEKGSWYYMGLWNPFQTAQNYHQVFAEKSDDALFVEFLRIPASGSVLALSPKGCSRIALTQSGYGVEKSPIVITDETMKIFKKAKIKADLERLATSVFNKNKQVSSDDKKELKEQLIEKADQYYQIGFRGQNHLASLLTWEAMLGPDFLENYSDGDVMKTIYNSKTAPEAMDRLKALLRSKTQ